MSIKSKLLIVGIALLLFSIGCKSNKVATSTNAQMDVDRFKVFAASRERSNYFTQMQLCPDGHVYFLAPVPLITNLDIKSASAGVHSTGTNLVNFELTKESSEVFLKQSTIYLDNYLFFQWDNQVIFVTTVFTPLKSKLSIFVDPVVFPDENIHEMIQVLSKTAPSF